MRYYSALFCVFVVLASIDLFFARLFMHINVSIVLAFLLTTAFIIPQKTRFIYRALIPLMLVCGLAADSMSAAPPGTIFVTYCFAAIIITMIARSIPSADSLGYLVLIVFPVIFIMQLGFGLASSGIGLAMMREVLLSSFLAAFFTTVAAIVVAYFFETPFGSGFGKILFNSDQ